MRFVSDKNNAIQTAKILIYKKERNKAHQKEEEKI